MPLTKSQRTIFDKTKRFRVVAAGRRFGKTFLSIWEIARVARFPNKNIYYIAPTYRQAKQIIWEELKQQLLQRRWVEKINESDLSIKLVNGSLISLRSADNFDSMRGVSLDFAVLDEAAFMKKETWTEVIRPALSDRKGGALFITTPKGRNWIYDLWTNAKIYADWGSDQFTTLDGGQVDEEEVEAAKRELDEKTFNQEYLATFETYEGIIYYNFNPEVNVEVRNVDLGNRTTIHVGMDFNVTPLVSALAVVDPLNRHIHIFDEIMMNGSNTYEMCEEIRNRFPNNRILAYPDASGSARKTSSIQSDHQIMKQHRFELKVGRVNPAVVDRIAAMNSSMMSSSGDIRLTIDPKCKNIIKCLSNQVYKEGTRIPDKDGILDHFPDAVGYLVNYINPISAPKPERPKHYGHYGVY